MRRATVLVLTALLLALAGSWAVAQCPGGRIHGAIFTGIEDASQTNLNHYDFICDPDPWVFGSENEGFSCWLLGGPGPNAPPSAAGLPEGLWVFQVTDPSGKVLLSTDALCARMVYVGDDGRIEEYIEQGDARRSAVDCVPGAKGGTDDTNHKWSTVDETVENQGAAVELCPYLETPNRGGVYKAWATPAACYVPPVITTNGGGKIQSIDYAPNTVFGFVPSSSKTDNFKIKPNGNPPDVKICVKKFADTNLNGQWDDGEGQIGGWGITITEPEDVVQNEYTDATDCLEILAWNGTWLIEEDTSDCTWVQTALILDGVPQSPVSPWISLPIDGKPNEAIVHEVVFGNAELAQVEVCKYYDLNGNNQQDGGEPGIDGWRFVLTGTDAFGNVVGPVEVETDGGCVGLGGDCGLVPGIYTVTELIPPNSPWVPSGDTSVQFEVLSGDDLTGTFALKFGNFCTGEADFGTKGYWHNKNGLARVMETFVMNTVNGLDPYKAPSSYFGAGDEPFDGEFQDGSDVAASHGILGDTIAAAGSWQAEVSQFLVDANAGGDPREQLAQQLLAFIFNTEYELGGDAAIRLSDGTWVMASSLIADAIAIWNSGSDAERSEMASILDGFNNSDAVPFIHATPCDVVYPD